MKCELTSLDLVFDRLQSLSASEDNKKNRKENRLLKMPFFDAS